MAAKDTCERCKRGSEVIARETGTPLGYYRCELRSRSIWSDPKRGCTFNPSKFERKHALQ